jgi:signal transduction histidine kinase
MDQLKPAGYEEIRREETARLIKRVLFIRALMVPTMLAAIAYLVVVDATWWRRVILVAAASSFAAVMVQERMRIARVGVMSYEPSPLQMLVVVGAIALLAVTGGIYSPFLIPVLAATPVFVATLGVQVTRVPSSIIGVSFALCALLQLGGRVLLPAAFVSASGGLATAHTVLSALLLVMVWPAMFIFAGGMRQMNDRLLERTLRARDEILRGHADQLRAMTTLSGEIAHELKNPLASVKGLAALAALEPARAPERLRILGHEIERMEGILTEFLNFSRPLVPLTQEETDLDALCLRVLELHEGLASGRNIALSAPTGGPRLVRCDRRKVQQILINLVQNAIDASSAGGEVTITIDDEADDRVVRVLDRGHGIPAEIKARVFEPGVTSKPRGSGLGLTIVRLLAEQHGGSVTLRDREGGGCVAELRLKRQGVVEVAA